MHVLQRNTDSCVQISNADPAFPQCVFVIIAMSMEGVIVGTVIVKNGQQ